MHSARDGKELEPRKVRPANSPALKGLLFDKDGTLLDYAASWSSINRLAAARAAGDDPDKAAELLRLAGACPDSGNAKADSLLAAANTAEIAAAWVEAGSPWDHATLVSILDTIFQSGVANAVAVTDLDHFFSRLKARGLKLGIASSDSETAIAAMVERFGIGQYIDFIAGYDSGHGAKPGPGMMLAFCRATGLQPHTVAVVGDNGHDVEMGKSAGAALTVGVLTGTGTVDSLAAADLCLNSIETLESVLFE